MFENVFKVISNQMIHKISLEDFPKTKNTTSQKCVAKYYILMHLSKRQFFEKNIGEIF